MMLVLYGPTVSGKTDLAIKLAKKYNGELISADSRQVYKGLDVGTGKVNLESKVERHNGYWIVDGIKINGFDVVKPEQNFSVADFIKFANDSIIRIIESKKLPIVVGGTGFYIKALLDGIGSIGIPQDPILRQELDNLSVDELYQSLEKLDPKRSKVMNESDRKNPRRLIRAIEVAVYKISTSERSEPTDPAELTAEASEVINHPTIQPSNYLLVSLTAPNDFLYTRADKWLEARVEKGLIEEVRDLFNKNVNPVWLVSLGLEYRWITKYLRGEILLDEAVKRLKGDIHSYIRRQKTYFNQFKNIKIFDVSTDSWQRELEKIVDTWYNQKNDRK